ncbi:replicative DNA helicase [Hwanghaeella grinnelliae]|uniref:Replicative DNA helicase n=1 Tax=Hwanghaeella grinnelliae TaxID=2500179 RepID=A0A437QVD8_9PROT|nr:replicative DNA helicase [Hwanghaeella grinnelliae]RVU38465.1 replicative DNA helicase [Hwanghaeella grinnelliae]
MTTPAIQNVHSLVEGEGDERTLREAPHNLEVEAALLGAILRNNRTFEHVGDLLSSEQFYAPEHQRIFKAIKQVTEKGQIANATTLAHILDSDPLVKEVGGSTYLYELVANVISVINAKDYAETIRDLYLKRELIGLGEMVVNEAYDLEDIDDSAEKQIERAEHRLYTLATTGEVDRGVATLKSAVEIALEAAEQAYQRDSHLVGVTTGFRDVDQMLGGLHRSDLLILAGRPSMGKTALATNMAFNAAKAYKRTEDEAGNVREEGGKVLFFSLEMSAEQLAGRILSERSEVSSDKIRRGEIENDEFERLALAAHEMSQVPLFIDDTPALTITGLRQRARRVKRQHGLHFIVVDYLQLLQGPPEKRSDNRVQEVSDITRGLKTLAKELDVPVLALSQLSRQVEQREDKRPQLSDLRESGSIEQDADVVTFIYRPEYYLQREHPTERQNEAPDKFQERVERHNQRLAESRNIAEVIIAKQRHGPIGIIELFFDGNYTRFGDLDRHHDDGGF